ncbi:MAG TPA: hypothetical protein VKX39_00965 [Bryobacteraceae bacterium]|jgi:excinuclease UvrABC nuclease subunit|nr:hypothetical protein [Bryobacteraceae bacterium]
MPFEQIMPRPFTPEGVRTYAPQAPGVYGISNAREWIYIGHAKNIQGALLDYFQDPGCAAMKKDPRGFVFELCDEACWSTRQDRLVIEYEPACNRHFVPARGRREPAMRKTT